MPTSNIHTVTVAFPELRMHPSAGHKLRGFFGNAFGQHADLLHNHDANGQSQYRYPLVQYKVVERTPMLLGIGEGAQLLTRLFLQMRHLDLEGEQFPIYEKNIVSQQAPLGTDGQLHAYRFATLWMGLNQDNVRAYRQMPPADRPAFLDRVLAGNILSLLKGAGHFEPDRVMVRAELTEQVTHFKNQPMLAFAGSFVTNCRLPAFAGLGKSVARGYGAVVEKRV